MDDQIPVGEYIIPRRISRGYQLMPGIGLKDAAFGAGGFALALVLWLTLNAFGVGLLIRGFVAMVPLILGAALALPLAEDLHVWEFARNFRQFGRKPKTLYYDFGADNW